jgi:hypothetical protein
MSRCCPLRGEGNPRPFAQTLSEFLQRRIDHDGTAENQTTATRALEHQMSEETPELDPTAGETAREKINEEPRAPREPTDPSDPSYDEEEAGTDEPEDRSAS